MVFSSTIFLLYILPAILIGYYLFSNATIRKSILLITSILFFAYAAPKFMFIALILMVINYYLVDILHKSTLPIARKLLLLFVILIDAGALIYYKYTGFFVENFNAMIGSLGDDPVQIPKVLLPIGISFIVLHMIGYAIDVKRKQQQPASTLFNYLVYMLMFPKLLAGPITKYKTVSGQIEGEKLQISMDERLSGFFRFAVGLAKKAFIANVLGSMADQIFALQTHELNSSMAWLGALAYTFQIYFDFSAYTDMALGIGMMLGFRLPENFNSPYIARSITEFWKRWHMSLSNWLRDYIFLPVAYSFSDNMKKNRYLNMKAEQWIYLFATMITMLVCGFWHGAAWTFIAWGAFQGVMMTIERMFLMKIYKKIKVFSVLITFFLTILGWVVFRSANFDYAGRFIAKMFTFNFGPILIDLDFKSYAILVLAFVFSFIGMIGSVEKWQQKVFAADWQISLHSVRTAAALILVVISIASITASGFNPFIYFRF